LASVLAAWPGLRKQHRMKTTQNNALASLFIALAMTCLRSVAADGTWVAPAALAASPDSKLVYVACSKTNRVLVVDSVQGRVVRSFSTPSSVSGIAVTPGGGIIWATCPAQSRVVAIDTSSGAIKADLQAGHTSLAPVLSSDGKTLFVCNRFDGDIGVYDLAAGKEVCRVPVRREPVAAALSRDGRLLLVANYLHDGKANMARVGAAVSVMDTADKRVIDELWLPSGSGSVNGIAVSPDGRYAVVTHIAARFVLPTTQLERGWMNANAMTLIDMDRMRVLNTVLLDSVDRGAANPWGVAWSGDGRRLVVAVSGTHEVSIADFPAFLEKLNRLSPPPPMAALVGTPYSGAASRSTSDVPNDLSFLVGLRERRALGDEALGPRAVVVAGHKAWIGNYFSDTLSVVDLDATGAEPQTIQLAGRVSLAGAALGELYFHDARICYQQWQSCASCHPGHGRADGLNWDLLNDGIGNARNTRSLLLAFQTPPAMSIGVRESAGAAIRAGVRHILFTEQSSRVHQALDAYVKSLSPIPSPRLVDGGLSAAAVRGKRIFESAETGCSRCHPPPLFTDLKAYNVGTGGSSAAEGTTFDTPTLVEVWRTAPYLHDGSATIREVLVERNRDDQHGKTSHLTADQLNDLAAYIQSL